MMILSTTFIVILKIFVSFFLVTTLSARFSSSAEVTLMTHNNSIVAIKASPKQATLPCKGRN